MKHLHTAKDYKFERYNSLNNSWEVVQKSELKKHDRVRVFDAETGEQLQSEHGYSVFEIIENYVGLLKNPLFA